MGSQEANLEMWAGLECTLNRVQNRWINQEDKNGHNDRFDYDFKLFETLGVKKTRYPCLWELVSPGSPDEFDWSILDERLPKLKDLKIDIIATFLHHGSGPKYTSLIDESFPQKFEKYAEAFAKRYPWVQDFTPINEINTTSRFSLLYGHWYPHHKMDHRGYVRSVFIQCKATILAMKAIRKVNPQARLVQTDDLGKCQSTPELAKQAEFENHRRWLSWDMLCGVIDESHGIYDYLKASGLTDEEMNWLKENACSPDYVGINHYLLSNRFLDDRKEMYQEEFYMDNGVDSVYADVGAIHTSEAPMIPSPGYLMEEAWDRYHLPIAVTEVHLHGDRSSQMLWLNQVWTEAKEVRAKGVNVAAITVWSLLGTYDWHKLCTVCELFYEPGVFDLRTANRYPRPTALSRLVQDLAAHQESKHPVLENDGWWKSNRRLNHVLSFGLKSELHSNNKARPLLICGAGGMLGQIFGQTCSMKNIAYKTLKRQDLDITDLDKVRELFSRIKPWAVINTAGYVNIDKSESEVERCFRENVLGPKVLAIVCAELNIPIVHFSSAHVFDGSKVDPYNENDKISPINIYGETKAESEKIVMEINPHSMIVRSGSFFGPSSDKNFVHATLNALIQQKEVVVSNDAFLTATFLPDLANATIDLLLDGVEGVVHLSNKGTVTWSEFASKTAEIAACRFSLNPANITSKSWQEMNFEAKRPRNSALVSKDYDVLPSLESALNRYFDQLEIRPA